MKTDLTLKRFEIVSGQRQARVLEKMEEVNQAALAEVKRQEDNVSPFSPEPSSALMPAATFDKRNPSRA